MMHFEEADDPRGSFPNEDAARKLVYLSLQNAVPQWTRTRNWTSALLAFKIHFGDLTLQTNCHMLTPLE
jgi:transposase-like protein